MFRTLRNAIRLVYALDMVIASGKPQTLIVRYKNEVFGIWCGVGTDAMDVGGRLVELNTKADLWQSEYELLHGKTVKLAQCLTSVKVLAGRALADPTGTFELVGILTAIEELEGSLE